MEVQTFVTDDDTWVPAVDFTDQKDSLLLGTVSFPLPSFLTADGALRLVESADRLIAWATSLKVRGLARVEEAIGEESPRRQENQPTRFGGHEAHALAVTEVATTSAVSEGASARSLNEAADFTTSRWQVLEAIEAGEISSAHARIIQNLARSLPDEPAETFINMALQRVRTRHGRRRAPSELRACLRRLHESLDPESPTARKAAAHRERGVWFSPEPDGMCTLSAYLSAEAGLAIFNGLDHDARVTSLRAAESEAQPGAGAGAGADSRTLSELRADALVQRLLGPSDGADAGAFRPEVVVTIPVELALASDAASAATAATAELEGYGPIDAATARRLAALAPGWQRVFTDYATGQALGVGRTAYRPPMALRRYLHNRDGTCRFPGCTRRATACEPDHSIEWQDGGATDADNLAMLCRRHHALKSVGAWAYKHASPTGELKWCSPLGRTYSTDPASIGRALHTPKPPKPPPF
ncbi:DUF222 domain-containing protein [Arthrobacter sp. UYCo732]|uniref:HNH endonuclease signature motif containing protein n=1 Tax=Arthrobacter sp. UYCo732 TaxID=3156336 RepID=UPI00339B2C06